MERNLRLTLSDEAQLCEISRALSVPTRVQMLKLLNRDAMNINELAKELDIPVSTAALHVKVLADAGLIFSTVQPGLRGSQKVCSRKIDFVQLDFMEKLELTKTEFTTVSMPVGCYSDCEGIMAPCGIVGANSYLDSDDEPKVFFNPAHFSAQLIWFTEGVLSYKFPNMCLKDRIATRIQFSLELCSECANYRNDWPSDITVWINGKEVGTYLSPGDFGGRRGRYSPAWWSDTYTQFGLLKTFSVEKAGTYIDNVKASNVTVSDLNLEDGDCIDFRIGVKHDAVNRGGMNLFGEKFGDYQQNIIMRLDHIERTPKAT